MANEELSKLSGGMISYRYVLDEDSTVAREVFALAEVPAPYRQRFREEIEHADWIVEYGRTLPEAPFKADFVLCTCDAAI
ncbi:hypothetical protein Q9Q94_13590 [Uliginosibacterium sp. 31-16]|uniref:hypothetical protein n=1 Tax=Uliginosibacterium sp. 31-16 TaxID=3068315 RepID=UPI00273E254F|nr:hypothetical protein [Uliginosibacterium sp. 31-16]MDP5240572.1 hypothetical protein [Uliginosibacterium sp. 31-16]